jgi:hypothetical protein
MLLGTWIGAVGFVLGIFGAILLYCGYLRDSEENSTKAREFNARLDQLEKNPAAVGTLESRAEIGKVRAEVANWAKSIAATAGQKRQQMEDEKRIQIAEEIVATAKYNVYSRAFLTDALELLKQLAPEMGATVTNNTVTKFPENAHENPDLGSFSFSTGPRWIVYANFPQNDNGQGLNVENWEIRFAVAIPNYGNATDIVFTILSNQQEVRTKMDYNGVKFDETAPLTDFNKAVDKGLKAYFGSVAEFLPVR